jgi:hypothetical protein
VIKRVTKRLMRRRSAKRAPICYRDFTPVGGAKMQATADEVIQ